MNTPTPRTDAAALDPFGDMVVVSFARTLERELTRAEAELRAVQSKEAKRLEELKLVQAAQTRLNKELAATKNERDQLIVIAKALMIAWGDKFSNEIKAEFSTVESEILKRAEGST